MAVEVSVSHVPSLRLKAMTDIKGDQLYVNLGASQVRRRLKGYGFGVRKVFSDGKNRPRDHPHGHRRPFA